MEIKSNETIRYYLFLKKAFELRKEYLEDFFKVSEIYKKNSEFLEKESKFKSFISDTGNFCLSNSFSNPGLKFGCLSQAIGMLIMIILAITYPGIDNKSHPQFLFYIAISVLFVMVMPIVSYFLTCNKKFNYEIELGKIEKIKSKIKQNNDFDISIYSLKLQKNEYDKLKDEYNEILNFLKDFDNNVNRMIGIFEKRKEKFIKEYDKNSDDIVDITESIKDFEKLLQKNQNTIIEVNREYVHQFIKLNEFLKKNRGFINYFYKTIKKLSINKMDYNKEVNNFFNKVNEDIYINDRYIKVKYISELSNKYLKELAIKFSHGTHANNFVESIEFIFNDAVDLFRKQVYSFEVLMVNALMMISALINNDLITFYKLYEKFDKFEVFESNWQRKMTNKMNKLISELRNINKNFYEIYSMIDNIGQRIENNFEDLNESTQILEENLKSIQSSVNVNTLLSGIAAYQSYKANKRLKTK